MHGKKFIRCLISFVIFSNTVMCDCVLGPDSLPVVFSKGHQECVLGVMAVCRGHGLLLGVHGVS